MSKRLEDKTALITAAGQGIGRATALSFSREGAKVWATDINEGALESLRAADPLIQTRLLDVRNSNAIEEMADETGAVDVLFNCAGFVHQGSILDCTEDDWNYSFDLNVTSIYRTCRTYLPGMLVKGHGSVINMSSIVSSLKGAPNRFAYASTKAAVIGLTKAIAADFVTKGIRCNAICPGTVETPSLGEGSRVLGMPRRREQTSSPGSLWGAWAQLKRSLQQLCTWLPMNRTLLPDKRSLWMEAGASKRHPRFS
jgi:2-keto-3-deoxy-L-fuconate dehydrogenase